MDFKKLKIVWKAQTYGVVTDLHETHGNLLNFIMSEETPLFGVFKAKEAVSSKHLSIKKLNGREKPSMAELISNGGRGPGFSSMYLK